MLVNNTWIHVVNRLTKISPNIILANQQFRNTGINMSFHEFILKSWNSNVLYWEYERVLVWIFHDKNEALTVTIKGTVLTSSNKKLRVNNFHIDPWNDSIRGRFLLFKWKEMENFRGQTLCKIVLKVLSFWIYFTWKYVCI